ncbi:MAG: hypothetical protein Q8O56_13335, partial [Solirubrobacteraceae bacterium]|nr:hypothetical protein [Solirubrobacteraceae bacterium]
MTLAASTKTGLECSQADIERILAAFLASRNLWDAVGLAGRPFHLVVEVARLLEERGLLSVAAGEALLTGAGKKLCRAGNLRPRRRHRCRSCQGRGISLKRFSLALERFQRLAAGRPQPVLEFDQAYV